MKARKKHSENTREMEIIEGRGGEEAGESRVFFCTRVPVLCKNFLLVLHSYSFKTISTSYICVCVAVLECVFNIKIPPIILNYLYEVKTMKLLLHMIHSAPLVKQQFEHLL